MSIEQKVAGAIEEVLQKVHAEQYHGLDDDMTDNYEAWLVELLDSDGEFEKAVSTLIN